VADHNILRAWLALHLVPGLGPVTCRKLAAHFGGPDEVLAAGPTALAQAASLRRESIDAITGSARERLDQLVDSEMDAAEKRNITILSLSDPLYPGLLKKIHDPPPVLYVAGSPELLDCRGIGMVGSRAATRYGIDIACRMASSLAGHGFTIVSGMALGVDTAAHNGALAGGGRTIAVLGCGLDIVYPPSNHQLFKRIVSSGAVVSEFPFGTKPDSFRFPARNRIISGLSLGVLVVEATTRSGSLITAGHALDQGREVFAVPGRIDSVKSAGTHTLLQQGAKLVLNIDDIIEELPVVALQHSLEKPDTGEDTPNILPELSQEETELYNCLDVYPRTVDEIVQESGLTAQKTNEILLHLELKGLVESLPGTAYRKCSALFD